jgi:hypothetical protein
VAFFMPFYSIFQIQDLISEEEHPDCNREGPGFESPRDHKATSLNEVNCFMYQGTFYILPD